MPLAAPLAPPSALLRPPCGRIGRVEDLRPGARGAEPEGHRPRPPRAPPPHARAPRLDLPDQDFTPAVELITSVDAMASVVPAPPLTLTPLHTLRIAALECAPAALGALLRALVALRVLELDFAREQEAVCAVLLERRATDGGVHAGPRGWKASSRAGVRAGVRRRCSRGSRRRACAASAYARSWPSAGALHLRVRRPASVRARRSRLRQRAHPPHRPVPAQRRLLRVLLSLPTADAEGDAKPGPGRTPMPRFTVRWSARQRGRDTVLDALVDAGRVAWVDEELDSDADRGA
ncbi:hypothetical protein FB451DRAFT_1413117 [Mycena latifolia]|nr:hypothetical protein FB451DRAFT_1413117 [Mycena latifolia]